MNLSKRYLTLVVMGLVPSLHGCLWESLHVDGTLDATAISEDTASKEAVSLNSEDNTNEDEESK